MWSPTRVLVSSTNSLPRATVYIRTLSTITPTNAGPATHDAAQHPHPTVTQPAPAPPPSPATSPPQVAAATRPPSKDSHPHPRVHPNTHTHTTRLPPPCYGCGARIDPNSGNISVTHPRLSYWGAVKQASSDYRYSTLCPRCNALRSPPPSDTDPLTGVSITPPSDPSPDPSIDLATNTTTRLATDSYKLPAINPQIFRDQIARIRNTTALVVLVVDSTEFEAGAIRSVRNLVGKNPIVLAATKYDLLPTTNAPNGRPAHDAAVSRFLIQRLRSRAINCIDVILCSGIDQASSGVDQLHHLIESNHNGRNVYFIGNVNAGKSTLVNAFTSRALVQPYFYRHGAPPATRRRRLKLQRQAPTTSALPGTTLVSIRIPCFKSHKHAVFDTPGLVPVRPDPWGPKLVPHSDKRRRIEPIARDIPDLGDDDGVFVLTCGDDMVRVEVRSVPASGSELLTAGHLPDRRRNGRSVPNRVVWYSRLENNALAIKRVGALQDAVVPTEEQQVTSKSDWVCAKELEPQRDRRDTYSADIVVWDVGWLAVCFAKPTFVRICTPGVAAQVTARPCMYHPLFVRDLATTPR